MKRIKILIAAALIGVLTCVPACSKGSVGSHSTTEGSGISQVLQSEIEKEDAKNSEADDNADSETDRETDNGTNDTDNNGGTGTDETVGFVPDDSYIMDDNEIDENPDADTSRDTTQDAAQDTTQNAPDQNNQFIGNVGSVSEEDYIDITGMSADMIYAVVYDMMCRPNDYIGKTVKIEGLFSYYCDPATENEYYACIIEDARACCAQGMEFVPQEQYKYPEDYPEMFDAITVTGTFDIYYEGEQQDIAYMTLRDAVIG